MGLLPGCPRSASAGRSSEDLLYPQRRPYRPRSDQSPVCSLTIPCGSDRVRRQTAEGRTVEKSIDLEESVEDVQCREVLRGQAAETFSRRGGIVSFAMQTAVYDCPQVAFERLRLQFAAFHCKVLFITSNGECGQWT